MHTTDSRSDVSRGAVNIMLEGRYAETTSGKCLNTGEEISPDLKSTGSSTSDMPLNDTPSGIPLKSAGSTMDRWRVGDASRLTRGTVV